jgi:hypothetical protein
MRSAASLLGLVLALGVGYAVYRMELAPGQGAAGGNAAVVNQADLAGVQSDLVLIGQAEQLYLAGHDSYATLDQLQQAGSVTFQSRHGYNFNIEVDGASHFEATATPNGTAKAGWPTFSMDETLDVTRQ